MSLLKRKLKRNHNPSRDENPRVATSLSARKRWYFTLSRNPPSWLCRYLGWGCKVDEAVNANSTMQVSSTPESNSDLAILVGLLLTDGSISSKKSSWVIEFTGKSPELHELFKEKMLSVFGNVHFTIFSDRRYKDIKRTKVSNKFVGERLLELVPTYRTRQFNNGEFPPAQIPQFVFKLPKNAIVKFLQAIFSCDGAISLWVVWNKRWGVWEIKKWVQFACKHPTIRRQVGELLNQFGFKPIIRPENDEILLVKKEDIIKFARTIRFVPGVEITLNSKNWAGVEKNALLNLAVKTYEIKQKDLKQFQTKCEIVEFLKSLV